MVVSIRINHGGTFNYRHRRVYVGGLVDTVKVPEQDFSHDVIRHEIVKLGYEGEFNIYFRQPSSTIARGLVLWVPGVTAVKLIDDLIDAKNIDIYVEHKNEVLGQYTIDEPDPQSQVEECLTQLEQEGQQEQHGQQGVNRTGHDDVIEDRSLRNEGGEESESAGDDGDTDPNNERRKYNEFRRKNILLFEDEEEDSEEEYSPTEAHTGRKGKKKLLLMKNLRVILNIVQAMMEMGKLMKRKIWRI